MTSKHWWWGLRLGCLYVGRCTRTQHLAILQSGRGTYCAWHRWRHKAAEVKP